MDIKLRETTNLDVEVVNSEQQVNRKLGHPVQIRVCRLTTRVKKYIVEVKDGVRKRLRLLSACTQVK